MALTKIGSGGIENVTNAANATFLTIDASEQITVASEGGAVTTSLQQGLAKAWWRVDNMAIIDSFNSASITDNGTGDLTCTCSSAMANDDYTSPLGTGNGATGDSSIRIIETIDSTTARTTTALRVRFGYFTSNALTKYDQSNNAISYFGDLA